MQQCTKLTIEALHTEDFTKLTIKKKNISQTNNNIILYS